MRLKLLSMIRIQWLMFAIILSTNAINRPVYKIVLTQKGFAQFLQYDVETPPIREFTFCTWLRLFDISSDQSIFSYVVNGNNRVVRLWLDSGGQYIRISLNGRPSSSALVDISVNTWHHICLSYQSDFGAWALYVDGRLTSCEAALSLHGFIIPGGGSIIIGYGITDTGLPNGLEGEIFGANMILTSTIERNYTIKEDPRYRQKLFNKNKLLENNNIKYVVLDDLSLDTTLHSSESRFSSYNKSRNFIKFTTPHKAIEHDVGLDTSTSKNKPLGMNEKEILDFSVRDKKFKGSNEQVNFWKLMRETGNIGKLIEKNNKNTEQSSSGTQEQSTISEYETPPPPATFQDFVRKNIKLKKPITIPYFEIKDYDKSNPIKTVSNKNLYSVSDMEVPPPPDKNTKVYGQWTSSQFANSVLSYIKNFNNNYNTHKRVPSTIPLLKLSDSFPYASNFKPTKVRAPFSFEKNIGTNRRIDKRDVKHPEINVQILQDDLRSEILESHARTQVQNVKIINRGVIDNDIGKDHRPYRDVENQRSSKTQKPRPFVATSKVNSNEILTRFKPYKSSNFMTILPFIKSAEYFIEGNKNIKSSSSNDIYTKTLTNANKWHNVKSYNNDYTPRHINTDSDEHEVNIDKKLFEQNKKYPSVRLKYMPENHKIVKSFDEETISNARALAMEISNLSNAHADSVSILKYNHGFLPSHNKNTKFNQILNYTGKNNFDHKKVSPRNNFNQNIKIGNALNERYIIGHNEEQNIHSFIGGDEKIPDINRSGFDRKVENVPNSLGPKICKTVELYDRLLYIQPDGSVDVTQIFSPIKEKNIGVEFIVQNYKKCSLEESKFKSSPLIFIDWNSTPVRLFGGSYPYKTKDLCGFF